MEFFNRPSIINEIKNEVSWNGQATYVETKTQWFKECSKKTQGEKDHFVDQGYARKMESKNISQVLD